LPTDVSLKFVSFHIDSLPIVNTQHKRNVRFHPRAKAQDFPAPENYNGFLAAGLFWSLLHPDPVFGKQISVFFLVCVIVAAIYGGMTAKRSILVVQGLPALLALIAVLLT